MSKKSVNDPPMRVFGPAALFIMLLSESDEPIGIMQFIKGGVSSTAFYNHVNLLMERGLIERAPSANIGGKPYKLTPLGKEVAVLLRQIEGLLRECQP
jgi:DNA-binding HxlR family transcriptional regulator